MWREGNPPWDVQTGGVSVCDTGYRQPSVLVDATAGPALPALTVQFTNRLGIQRTETPSIGWPCRDQGATGQHDPSESVRRTLPRHRAPPDDSGRFPFAGMRIGRCTGPANRFTHSPIRPDTASCTPGFFLSDRLGDDSYAWPGVASRRTSPRLGTTASFDTDRWLFDGPSSGVAGPYAPTGSGRSGHDSGAGGRRHRAAVR